MAGNAYGEQPAPNPCPENGYFKPFIRFGMIPCGGACQKHIPSTTGKHVKFCIFQNICAPVLASLSLPFAIL